MMVPDEGVAVVEGVGVFVGVDGTEGVGAFAANALFIISSNSWSELTRAAPPRH